MADFLIREYKPSDIPELKRLWAECFGDPEQMVDSFYAMLPSMGFGLCAEAEGKIAGAAHMIQGMSLEKDRNIPCAYLYAVGVFSEFRSRGVGSGLSRACAELAKERGAEIICTQPAKKSLYKWYEEIIGTEHKLCRKIAELESKAGKAEIISPEHYHSLREELLSGKEHMKASLAVIEFERELCIAYGGDLFKTEKGIAAAYIEDGSCHIKELLTVGNSLDEAAAVAAALNTDKVFLYEAADTGDSYIAFDNDKMSTDCIWNISFD
ncbi:MAG: GNAT family N-acetyltransferase [Oscillospiraceae bacterium]|nr:GNAT family N-acetyltransferase [Oscillospiraceae bacterium]